MQSVYENGAALKLSRQKRLAIIASTLAEIIIEDLQQTKSEHLSAHTLRQSEFSALVRAWSTVFVSATNE